jgi:glycosyltransferase involved in cell wall biosynthesis
MIVQESLLEESPRDELSIIVTTYDIKRIANLRNLIDSLAIQTFKSFELVLVIEKSRELCELMSVYTKSKGLLNTKIIFNDKQPGISGSRNIGISFSHGGIVCIVDDDVILPEKWCEGVKLAFEELDPGALTGPVIPLWADNSISWLPKELHWILGCSSWFERKTICQIRNVWGANMAFRRYALLKAGGFSSSFGGMHGKRLHGEEVDLCLRISQNKLGKIFFVPSLAVRHTIYKNRLSPRFVMRSSFDMGRTRAVLKKMYGSDSTFLEQEMKLIIKIIHAGIILPFVRVGSKPKESLNIFFLSSIVLLSACIGYVLGLTVYKNTA